MRVVVLVVWAGAIVMAVGLAWRVNRLDARVQQTLAAEDQLAESAHQLRVSVEETEAAMKRLQARVDALDAGDAQIIFERR
jgi:hypothetical protein